MDALDGNAIAGTLRDVFGAEMTTAVGICADCGVSSYIGEYLVYSGGPGIVVRCRHCDNVAIVLVEVRGRTCVDAMGLSGLHEPV